MFKSGDWSFTPEAVAAAAAPLTLIEPPTPGVFRPFLAPDETDGVLGGALGETVTTTTGPVGMALNFCRDWEKKQYGSGVMESVVVWKRLLRSGSGNGVDGGSDRVPWPVIDELCTAGPVMQR